MDNRFKFRAWITKGEKMVPVSDVWKDGISFLRDGKGTGLTFLRLEGGAFHLMQCSALPDKHGTLIYEGDICEDSAGHEYIIGFTPLEGFYRAPIKEQHHHCTLKNHRDLAVVGNVYEGRFNDTVLTVDYVDRTGSEPHPYKV